jgi:hypothetical protein
MPPLTFTAMKRSCILVAAGLTIACIDPAAGDDRRKSPAPAAAEGSATALPRVSAGDIEGVKNLVGKKAVVFGKVISANEVEKSGTSFLELDGGKFTVVCFKENYSKFEGGQSPAKIYKGKDIEVTGEIFEYRGKTGKGSPQPEIKLTDPTQIKVISAEKKDEGKDAKDKKETAPEGKSDAGKETPKKVNPKKYFK